KKVPRIERRHGRDKPGHDAKGAIFDRSRSLRFGLITPALLVGRRADDVLVGDDFVIALLFPLEIEIADAQRAAAVVDAEDAALLFVPGGDEPVVAGLLLGRALAAAIARGDAEGARLDVRLAGIVRVLAG